MIRALGSLAFNTLREAIRNKVFGSLVFVALLTLMSSLVLGEMSLHQELRVMRVVTHFATSLFTMVIVVYSSITLLHTEMERRTIYTILSKPIPRWLFLFGKYLGVQLLVAIVLAFFGLLTAGLYAYAGVPFHESVAWGFVGIWFQMLIVTALALFFASFMSPLLAGFCTLSMFVGGNLFSQLDLVQQLLNKQESAAAPLVELLRVLLPNLEALNLSPEITLQLSIPLSYVQQATLYTAGYVGVVLSLAVAIFSRRDFS